jgi:p-aminobenzoyl-glutamate transporter AbgT
MKGPEMNFITVMEVILMLTSLACLVVNLIILKKLGQKQKFLELNDRKEKVTSVSNEKIKPTLNDDITLAERYK